MLTSKLFFMRNLLLASTGFYAVRQDWSKRIRQDTMQYTNK